MASLLSIVIIAGVVLVTDHLQAKKTASSSQSQVAATTAATPARPSATTSSSTQNTSSYKDGTYTASSDYYVPHGDQSIQVTLTLSNGTITNASVKNSESDPTSASYQEDFASAYKSYVVGQKISSLQLSRISGASDTTQGFDDALSQIASKAQA